MTYFLHNFLEGIVLTIGGTSGYLIKFPKTIIVKKEETSLARDFLRKFHQESPKDLLPKQAAWSGSTIYIFKSNLLTTDKHGHWIPHFSKTDFKYNASKSKPVRQTPE